MAEVKTTKNDAGVEDFLNKIDDETKRKDCFEIVKIMKQATKEEPKMWGASIVGFGSYHYKYESGREGDSMIIGFSPRKQNITLYISGDGFEQYDGLMKKLGKHSIGKGCLYIKKLEDVDTAVLKELVNESAQAAKAKHSS
ncbi:MAG: DUF1801 domain-containing protein [Anaerolineales bacterium]|nr:DUF1801 domain-containing protein [Anaerolineales bacterium]